MASPPAPPSPSVARQFLASFAAAIAIVDDAGDQVSSAQGRPCIKRKNRKPKHISHAVEKCPPPSSPEPLPKPRRLTPELVHTTAISGATEDATPPPSLTAAARQRDDPVTIASAKRYSARSASSTPGGVQPRRLTPERVPNDLSNASPFQAAKNTTDGCRNKGKKLSDPFSRSFTDRTSHPHPEFLPSSVFPALGSSSSSQTAEPKPPKPSTVPLPEPDRPAVQAAAEFHAACVRSLPRFLVSAVRVLVGVAVVDGDAEQQLPDPVVGLLHTRAALADYARTVLEVLAPELSCLPSPIVSAFATCEALSVSSALQPSAMASFPRVDGSSWSAVAEQTTGELSSAVLPQRLTANLEAVWDDVLALQRRFRGDVSGIAPGDLDARSALTAIGRLHPAAADLLATRLLDMVADAALTAGDGAPPKMRQLGARLRGAGSVQQQYAASGRGGKRGTERGKGGGVVLHRLPEVVRRSFADDQMQLFVLDFLTVVDSARLAAALLPRVSAALKKALGAAAAATSNSAFTDAVVDARLFARLLALTMHAPNWAHSEYALEGANVTDASKGETMGLDRHALASRAPVCSATWTAAFDIGSVVKSAVQSGQTLAVVAAVAVADILLRLAVVDPIARATEWFDRAVRIVREVRVRPNGARSAGKLDDLDVTMPLVDIIVGELVENDVGSDTVLDGLRENGSVQQEVVFSDCDAWVAIGDIRLIRECCPALDELRQKLLSSKRTGNSGQRMMARRITPLAAAGSSTVSSLTKGSPIRSSATSKPNIQASQGPRESESTASDVFEGGDDSVEAVLRREFYKRMDGRLRELIRVVVASKPVDEAAAVAAYTKIANVLYPTTPQTIVAVAAHICAGQVARNRMESKEQGNTDKGQTAPESQLNGVGCRSNPTRQNKVSTEDTKLAPVAPY